MKAGKKVYGEKQAELKIERFASFDQNEVDGKRIGYQSLNLGEFIGSGLKVITLKMDKEEQLYLTLKLSVIETNEQIDVIGLVIKATATKK